VSDRSTFGDVTRLEDFAYRRIAQAVREAIAQGQLTPGDPVPSAKTLSQEHGVALETARKALRLLLDDEVIVRVSPGLPFYVADTPPRAAS
jgi:DNA-binding GntR family transcriptional regulator